MKRPFTGNSFTSGSLPPNSTWCGSSQANLFRPTKYLVDMA